MALSGNEIFLILRARDEASRVLNRVSRTMSAMDRQAYSSSAAAVTESKKNLTALQRGLHDVEYGYQKATIRAREMYQSGAIDSRQYQQMMLDARKARVEQMYEGRQAVYNMQDQIKQHEEFMKAKEEEAAAMKEHGHALMNNGYAAITAGATMTAFGIAGIRAYSGMLKASMDYTTQARYTLTQVDQTGVKLKTIEKIGQEVGRTVPVAFQQIQPALYDIFSSMDVSVKGSQKILHQFAKDAVGGQTDLATATRANIAIMNAYGIKAKDVSKVSDFMFQLVRKGVGTYHDFATTIGYAIPSAARLGVTLNQLGGVLAFMTRNGLSASRSATSAGRAFDALSNPGTVSNLKALGVNILNAKGELKGFPTILDLMAKKMKGMNKFQKSGFLAAAFKGSGGTIQALRFFNLAFKHMDKLHALTKQMENDSGTAQKAYETMAKSPAAQIQNLKNQFELLAITLGNLLLPYAVDVVKAIAGMVKWFNALPGPVKKAIAIFGAIATILLTVVGVITMVSGVIMIVGGAAAAMGISVGALIGIFTGVGVVIAAVVGIGILLYKNWNKIGPVITGIAKAIMTDLHNAWSWIVNTFGPAINAVWDGIKKGWNNLVDSLKRGWSDFTKNINWGQVKKDWGQLQDAVHGLMVSFNKAKPVFLDIGRIVGQVIANQFRIAGTVIRVVMGVLGSLIGGTLHTILTFGRDVAHVLSNVIDAGRHLVNAYQALFHGQWSKAWHQGLEFVKSIGKAFGNAVKALFDLVINSVKTGVAGIVNLFKNLYNILVGHSIIPDMINAIEHWFRMLPGKIVSAIASLPGKVVGFFRSMASRAVGAVRGIPGQMAGIAANIVSSLAGGIANGVGAVASAAASLAGAIPNAVKHWLGIHSPSKVMRGLGNDVVNGLVKGLQDGLPKVKGVMAILSKSIAKALVGSKLHMKQRAALENQLVHLPSIDKKIKALEHLSDRFDKVAKRIEQTRNRLNNLKKAKSDYISNVASTIKDYGNMGNFGTPQDVFGNDMPVTATYIQTQLQQRLATIKQFGANLKKLLQMGYSKAVYDQVVQMGPEVGSQYAAALVAATPDQVSQINQLTSSISSSANDIAQTAGSEMYDAGISAAEGLLKGLQAKEKAILKYARELAHKIADIIRKALQTHSPSRVTHKIGVHVGMGLVNGMAAQEAMVARAADRLARAAMPMVDQTYARTPVVGATQGGAGGTNIHQEITVHTNEINPRQQAQQLGWELANRYRT